MKRKTLRIVAIALLVVSAFAVGVTASDMVKEISATINYELKMKVDNAEWNPTEADGTAIRPITYNGRTYLPVRALGEKLGVAIDYDAETQTVLIGNKEWTKLSKEMIEKCRDSIGWTTDMDLLYCAGKTFEEGLVFKANQYDWCSETTISTSGKYQTVKMTLCYDKGESKKDTCDFKVMDTNDSGTVYKMVTVKDGQSVDIEVDIKGCEKLFLKKATDSTGKFVVGNIQFK